MTFCNVSGGLLGGRERQLPAEADAKVTAISVKPTLGSLFG